MQPTPPRSVLDPPLNVEYEARTQRLDFYVILYRKVDKCRKHNKVLLSTYLKSSFYSEFVDNSVMSEIKHIADKFVVHTHAIKKLRGF